MAEKSVKERAKRLFELKDVEVKTRGVEEMLAPLIKQVTTLQNNIPGRTRNKRLRNVFRLIQIVDKATENFTTAAENIAADNPEFQEELWLAIEEVRTSGNFLHEAAHDYTSDVLASRKRETMEERAAGLLRAVTRLLVLIDLIDINELFKASSRIEAKLERLKQVQTWETFVESMKAVTKDIRDVSETAIARQKELKSSTAKQLLVAAHTELSQQARMLITSTKTFLQHPEDESAIENRDYTINCLGEVLKTVARLADGEDPETIQKDLDNPNTEETVSPPSYSAPTSPVHPPSSHVYPIEYHLSAPSMLPPPALHGAAFPLESSQTMSSDDEQSMDSSYYRRPLHHNPRVSGEFDHLQSNKRESDHMTSQDTYTSCSSFSNYKAEDEDESAVEISERAQYLTGQSTSKMYQVSSGTLPTMQLNSAQISTTHEYARQGGNGEQTTVSHANPTQGGMSVSGNNSKNSASLQITRGSSSSGQSYPRGHSHSAKVSVSATAMANQTSQGSNVTVPYNARSHQSYQRGQKSSAATSSASAFASGQPSKVAGVSVSHKPFTLTSYPRGHSHSHNVQLSPAKAYAPGTGGAFASVASPPRSVEKSLEKFETILEQTAATTSPPPLETTEKLQAGFDAILNAASVIADSDSTRDQHGLLAQCDVVREKLQNLLKVIVTDKKKNTENEEDTSLGTDTDDTLVDERGEGDGGEDSEEGGKQPKSSVGSSDARAIRKSVQMIEEETAELRTELRKAMIEHVSDTFVDPCVPLTRMVAAAKQGNRRSVDKCSEPFLTHAEKLVHVANLVCSLTSDGPANREVRMAAKPIESLKHQVVSAAKTLVGHPDSETALKNMTAFQDLWIEKVNTLTDAVDKIIPLQDFIAVTEANVRDDSRRVVEAVEVGNFSMCVGCANVIQGRYDHLVQVVKQDMVDHASRYAPEHAQALENVMERMTGKVLPGFQTVVHSLCNKNGKVYDSDVRNLEDHLQNINDGVRDMRIYVLRTRTKEELKAEPDVDDIISPSSSGLSTPSSFEFMSEEMFAGNMPITVPSPILNRASKHSEEHPQIEVDIEEVEVTGQQYAAMLSYSSNMNILEEIKEEPEDTDTEKDTTEDDKSEEEDRKERERAEREKEERDREEREKEEREKEEREREEKQKQEEEEKRQRAEKEKEEEIMKKNEELLSKNFKKQRKHSRLYKASSEMRLQDERPTIEDEDYVTATGTLRRRLIKRTPSVAVINETETAKAVLAQLSVQEQESIAKEQEKLDAEHKVFEKEVNQWDDSSNDIISLAKEMCWMVMDMSDFLRGEGELMTTMDVVNTAKDVTDAAKKLILLVQTVADMCPDGNSKNDLLAYLDRMKLFCNQLKISSGVLTDLGSMRDTADNINNLLISATSLMNTVVLVVKGCYVASNAIKRRGGKLPVEMLQWKMMKPKKKLLYSRESLNQTDEQNPRITEKSAILELGAFRGRNSVIDGNEDTIARVKMEEKIRKMKRNRL